MCSFFGNVNLKVRGIYEIIIYFVIINSDDVIVLLVDIWNFNYKVVYFFVLDYRVDLYDDDVI